MNNEIVGCFNISVSSGILYEMLKICSSYGKNGNFFVFLHLIDLTIYLFCFLYCQKRLLITTYILLLTKRFLLCVIYLFYNQNLTCVQVRRSWDHIEEKVNKIISNWYVVIGYCKIRIPYTRVSSTKYHISKCTVQLRELMSQI